MNHEQIEGFAALFGTVPKLTEIEIRHEGATLRLRRNTLAPVALSPVASPPGALAPEVTTPTPPRPTLVTAEHVGVFQAGKVAPGETVKAGQVLGQIDTMRLLSDCKAPRAGVLAAVLVEDGQPVEYGQPLFELRPEEN